MHSNQHQPHSPLYEGLEVGDLARLVYPELHIDEFKSKMGEDADIIVLSFVVEGKEPAADLMNFIERGYDWVLDSDVSSGELDNGEYVVFVELERTSEAAEQVYDLVKNILNLTNQELSEWTFKYRKKPGTHDISIENIQEYVPLTPDSYIEQYSDEEEEDEEEVPNTDDEMDAMLETARVPMSKKAPKNEFTESLRIAAGLK